jgi:hypothetical protein
MNVTAIRETIFDGLATQRDFAEAVGLTESTVRVYRDQGLPFCFIGTTVYIPLTAFFPAQSGARCR